MTPPYDAVLFDFSGTLFRLTESPEWFDGMVDVDGKPIDGARQAELLRRLTAPVGEVVEMTDAQRISWQRRDLDPADHRTAYLAVLAASGLAPQAAESLYHRVIDPASWQPYPDTAQVLASLATSGTKVAVVSNIAFDVRQVFARHGIEDLVESYTLSYEVGAIKPDPAIFAHALGELEVPAKRALMVGDSELADGGARVLGCDFALVEPLPTGLRPTALLSAIGQQAA